MRMTIQLALPTPELDRKKEQGEDQYNASINDLRPKVQAHIHKQPREKDSHNGALNKVTLEFNSPLFQNLFFGQLAEFAFVGNNIMRFVITVFVMVVEMLIVVVGGGAMWMWTVLVHIKVHFQQFP